MSPPNTSSPRVQPAANPRDRLRDFTLDGISFDHKTSIWPRAYPGALAAAQDNPTALIQWLYANQSGEGRYHTANRLFVVLHTPDGAHWKLKADLRRLRAAVHEFLLDPQLRRVTIENGQRAVTSAVIWVAE